MRTLSANGDIMIRTLCLVFAFTWFTARGARAGDVTIAANAVLLHFFEVAAYLIDGFAYASEALVGQSVGAKNRERFKQAIRLTTLWALVVGAICSAIIWFAGPWFIDLMTVNPEVRETARHFLFWAALDAIARHHLLSVRRHFHRRHGDARHAQHDGAVPADLSGRLVGSRAQFRQSRPLGGAQCFLYRPRHYLCYAYASTCTRGFCLNVNSK